MKRPPRDLDTLRDEILARMPKLSHRLQQIARFVIEHPDDVALQTITMIASRIGVSPSAIIRFAKALDYRGFRDMQAAFRVSLSEGYHGNGKQQCSFDDNTNQPSVAAVLKEVHAASSIALEQLLYELPSSYLEQAAELMAIRRIVYVVGKGSAFPAAAYLVYTLRQLQHPVHLLDGIGGMLLEQVNGITDQDVLIAISSPHYTLEIAELAEQAASCGAAVIAITNNPLDPLTGSADVCLEVHEHKVFTFSLLIATINLVQSLVITLALRRGQTLPSSKLYVIERN